MSTPRTWVKGCVRVKPSSNPRDTAVLISRDDKFIRVETAPFAEEFGFFHVLDACADQKQTYVSSTQDVVEAFVLGYNGCVVVCGQSRSGKSHTLGWPQLSVEENGLAQLAVQDIFRHIANSKPTTTFMLSVSLVELQGQVANDLLDPTTPRKSAAHADTWHEKVITHPDQLLKVVAAVRSSRLHQWGHIMLRVKLEHGRLHRDHSRIYSKAVLWFVEIAGDSSSQASVLDEILPKCEGSDDFDSVKQILPDVLLSVLSNALGGTCVTSVIGTLSPSKRDVVQSVATAGFVNRAQRMSNNPQRNHACADTAVQRIEEELACVDLQSFSIPPRVAHLRQCIIVGGKQLPPSRPTHLPPPENLPRGEFASQRQMPTQSVDPAVHRHRLAVGVDIRNIIISELSSLHEQLATDPQFADVLPDVRQSLDCLRSVVSVLTRQQGNFR